MSLDTHFEQQMVLYTVTSLKALFTLACGNSLPPVVSIKEILQKGTVSAKVVAGKMPNCQNNRKCCEGATEQKQEDEW